MRSKSSGPSLFVKKGTFALAYPLSRQETTGYADMAAASRHSNHP